MRPQPTLPLHPCDEAREALVPDEGLPAGGSQPAGKNPLGDFHVRPAFLHPGLDVLELHVEEAAEQAVEPDGEAVVAVIVLREFAGLLQADLVEHPAEVVQAAGGLVVRRAEIFHAGHGRSFAQGEREARHHWFTRYPASGLSINGRTGESGILGGMIIAVLVLALLVVLVGTESAEIRETPPVPPMKAEPCLPRIIALAILAVIVLLAFTGCVSSRYKEAGKSTPPPRLLNVAFAPAPLEAALSTLITYNGPGAWKRDAFWDEYVVTLHNPGSEPLTVSSAGLVDFVGAGRAADRKSTRLNSSHQIISYAV